MVFTTTIHPVDINELLKQLECCASHAALVMDQVAPALRQQQQEIERVQAQLTEEIVALKQEIEQLKSGG